MLRAGAIFVLFLVCSADAQVDVNATYAPSNLTQEEKDLFLDVHNELRAKAIPEAANMKFMEWDDSLAAMAQAWSEECIWGHGQPEPNISPFSDLGQNLYLITGYVNRPSGRAVTTAWYNEIEYYTLETGACKSGKMCGHYTQLAWANSYALGCAMDFCDSAEGTNYNNLWLVTCNYGPPGNYQGQKPYKPGTNCTKCDSGVGECYNGLCRPCSDHTEECVCAQTCESCGVLNSTTCSCQCPNGFQGTDCSDICEDFDRRCGVFNGGYPTPWCWDEKEQDFMHATCPATCGLCVVDRDPDFECDGVPTLKPPTTLGPSPTPGICLPLECQNEGVFNEESCECICTAQYQGTLCEELKTTLGPEPTHCPQLECQNDGRYDEEFCKCRCTPEYQGKLCQHNREEAANGVVVILSADIDLWGRMEPVLRTVIAESLTTHCNDNFETCCPNNGPKNTSEKLAYANESNIQVADGYPEPSTDVEGAFSTMFLARGLEEAELCVKGGTPPVRRRRGVAVGGETHVIRVRATITGVYLDQDILLQVIRENTAKLAEGLADAGINASIASVEAGKVEPPDVVTAVPPPLTALPPTRPVPYPGLSPGAIAGIVIGSVVLLALCVGLTVVVVMKLSTSNITTVKPLKEDQLDMKSNDSNNYPTKNDYESTTLHC